MNIKKIVAMEGLIFLVWFILFIPLKIIDTQKEVGTPASIPFVIICLIYPIYLILRFILWAIDTINAKTMGFKMIVAREGLIFLGWFILVFLTLLWEAFATPGTTGPLIPIFFALYPVFLLVRFIIWAILKLRQKD